MKSKFILLILFFLFINVLLFSNENKIFNIKDAVNESDLKFNFSAQDKNIIKNYSDGETKTPLLTKERCIDFIIAGSISIGGFVILSSIGAVCIGALYNIFISFTSVSLACIVIGATSIAIGGLFLILGIVLVSIGGVVFGKYYKNNKVSFFNYTKDNSNNIGISIKLNLN